MQSNIREARDAAGLPKTYQLPYLSAAREPSTTATLDPRGTSAGHEDAIAIGALAGHQHLTSHSCRSAILDSNNEPNHKDTDAITETQTQSQTQTLFLRRRATSLCIQSRFRFQLQLQLMASSLQKPSLR
ncbi:hypothetical protein G7046_g5947 [Stylonectria norvegica]|nr:hypothetical protein G7046_g5947 [Stylonectria norvegica]